MTIGVGGGLLGKPAKGEPMNTLTASLSADRARTASSSSEGAARLTASALPGKKSIWAGRVLSGLGTAFLLFDGTIKLVLSPQSLAAATADLGWPANMLRVLGVLELVCLAVYLVPRTAVLGAVLWTGYLGGAIATHLRVASPLLSHTLFPIYVAALIWGGLWLRDRRVRALFSL
jgi:hypothetical protein